MVDIPDGVLTAVETAIDGEDASLIVYRQGDRLRAWHNVCPHAGRRLDWSPGRFLMSRDCLLVCAVHGASFETDQGRCVAGPCLGERLRAVAVSTEDGLLVLDLAQQPKSP
ncbi:MAG: rieske [2Fe-2S] domain protein [Xanthomonadaceae bacterium]|nr:rieske [2Fe-2S] domain protein [Xanthomonadaceae bacterium]